jgi:5-formyltetrahydrofolate cyclo-ligase
MNKQTLRQINRQRLAALSQEDKALYDAAIIHAALDMMASLPGHIVSVYNPMPFEVDCTRLTEALYAQEKRLCFPARLNPDHPQLIFRELTQTDYAASNKSDLFLQGMHYPVVSPDILIVPVVGFHPIGYRLGYGGGYYDSGLYVLRQQKNVTAIGLGYSFLEITLPFFESHDEKLDIVITEKQVIKTA